MHTIATNTFTSSVLTPWVVSQICFFAVVDGADDVRKKPFLRTEAISLKLGSLC